MIERRSKLSAVGCRLSARGCSTRRAFTLVEMLVAMAITLVMMAAVVTLFANVSNSVRNRRATIEMTNRLRDVRNTLQQDLQGATCPGVTWQQPESNHGYIELIEGPANDRNPTQLIRDLNNDGDYLDQGETQLDVGTSTIPRNNIGVDGADGSTPDGEITAKEIEAHYKTVGSFVPGGLGDHDDVLMLTVRNEHEPFVGRTPTNVRNGANAIRFNVDNAVPGWDYGTIESPLAEVVWFCVENPPRPTGADPNRFFGEPGIRTVYRRTLLIAPWVNPYSQKHPTTGAEVLFQHDGDSFKAEPGLVRVLSSSIALDNVQEAIASIIAFQDRYDLSVRLEWDHNITRWKIMANTLADLTKRENRFGHYGFWLGQTERKFPFAMMSIGRGYPGSNVDVAFVTDPEVDDLPSGAGSADFEAVTSGSAIDTFTKNADGNPYPVRPFAYVDEVPGAGGVPATANAVLDEKGNVVRVTIGPVPLWGSRRGQDVVMTEVLGFDVRVYDPGAPLYGRREIPGNLTSPLTVLQPSDPGWRFAYNPIVGSPSSNQFEFMGQGAYVDMGYAFGMAAFPTVPTTGKAWVMPWFAVPRGLSDFYGKLLAPGYSVYDTWSFHYENNGIDEDNRDGDNNLLTGVDEGTDGLDNPDIVAGAPINGPDDVGERETVPPYDKPLRGVQVLIRGYEFDSRAIRQVRVNQHFLPE